MLKQESKNIPTSLLPERKKPKLPSQLKLTRQKINEIQLLLAKQKQARRKAMESTEEHQPLEHKFDKPQATEQVNRR